MTTSSHPARTFFLYILAFATLYMVAISLGGVLWQLINKTFADAAFREYGDFYRETIRGFLATLIVTFPIYALMTWKVRKEQTEDEMFRRSAIRKWLTYITIFAAAVIGIVDLIALVRNFIGGEITVRFILKVIVVFVISGGIFWYYLRDIQKNS